MDPVDQRRRHPRATLRGVARLASEDAATDLLAVRDLSAGGLRVAGSTSLAVGARVEIELRLFGEAIEARGRIAWSGGPGHDALGVALDRGGAVDLLCDELEARLARRRSRGRALLVGADAERAALLGEYLWSHGYEVEEVAAPLSAIDRLAVGDVSMVAIGPHLSTCSGGEFAAFVAENYPRVHRLVVSHGARGTGAHTVATAFEAERPVSGHAVVCDDGRCRPRRS